jgi:hypothetical protein
MEPDDFEIEEYRSLRNSIDMHMKLIPEIFTIMIAASSALLGVGFKYQLFLLFLLPVLTILAFSSLILAQMNEIMFKGAYIKRRYEEKIFGLESTLFTLRGINGKEKKVLARAAEDAQAFVLIIDILLIICFSGFSLFLNLDFILSIIGANQVLLLYIIIVFLLFIWICVAWCTYMLNIEMLKAYTFEKEQEILDKLDQVFKNNEESRPQGERQ